MKILVICQHYFPEPFRITDICQEFVKRGHQVDVVTGVPNYPMGKIYDGYKRRQKRDETIEGVQVHRCFVVPRKQNKIFRFLNYFSFAVSSTNFIKKINKKYDAIFVNQLSPVMMANAGVYFKKKHGTKLIIYCLDLWPESLVFGGIKPESLVYRYFHKVSKKIYTYADRIVVSSKSFSDYFVKEFGIHETLYLPQFSELIFTPELCKKKPNGKIDLMFAGNVGYAQSVGTIVQAAEITRHDENIRWHIVGEGSEISRLEQKAKGLKNITFHGRKALNEMPKYYAMADAMLVTLQKNTMLKYTLPGKVQTYLAAGKPILGATNGETARVIKEAECGYCCEAEDAEALAKLSLKFALEPTKELFSKNAQAYYQKNFSKDCFMNRILEVLEN